MTQARDLPLLRRLALVEGAAMALFVCVWLSTDHWPVLGGVLGAVIASFFYLRARAVQSVKEGKHARR